MNFRYIIFILVYFIASLCISSTASDEEVLDLVTNESQIELPPLNNIAATASDKPPAVNIVVEQPNNDEIKTNSINQIPTEQTESTSSSVIEQSTSPDINKSETIQENLTIPVFSEWTQQMQEAEKKLVELTGNSTDSNKDGKNETLAKHQIVKMMRQKNYASPDCGAKILASNPEAQSSSSVLSDKKDEYMLSPCTDRIWFVIELCDSIQARRVELANFELFSSPLKAVSISVSNRFPTRDWTLAGHYDAKSERDVQVFELKDVTLFGKFVRVDLEYTNTEHYCPLSFFRIFGTSEIEAFEVENEPDNRNHHIDDVDDYVNSNNNNNINNQNVDANKDNILNRAGAAVMSIVQKAAEVLAKSNGNGAKQNDISSKQFQDNCMSLSHDILCEICSSDERTTLSNIITCKNSAIKNLLEDEVKEYLVNAVTCTEILGFNLKTESLDSNKNFIASILPDKYIAAMCNVVASDQKALPLRIEDISEITSKLISKKDAVSLRNVSGDVECKRNNNIIETVETDVVDVAVGNVTELSDEEVVVDAEKKANLTDDQNIFNNVDHNQIFIDEVDESSLPSSTIENEVEKKTENEVVVVEEEPSKEEDPPKAVEPQVEVRNPTKISNEPTAPLTQTNEIKPDPSTELKNIISGNIIKENNKNNNNNNNNINNKEELRSSQQQSNAPESVFLRLSNRIKVLEKNMTLSTQYLEELSRRYKKQIEDLQQAYTKLQTLYDNLMSNRKELDRKDTDDKKRLRDDVDELSKKSDFLEIVLIVLTSLLILLVIFIIVLFKRLSILRDAFIVDDSRSLLAQNSLAVTPLTNGSAPTKKKAKRVRKISAPNILSQRNGNGISKTTGNEFSSVQPKTLNRTESAPMKVNEMEQSTMLEENDEILLSAFEELKLNDMNGSACCDAGPKSNNNNNKNNNNSKDFECDFDTTSTASVKTDEHNSNGSVNFVRRLSSSPTFLKLKKTTALKINKNGRSSEKHMKKAKSESPPNIKSNSHNISIIQKSNSFEEDALKIRKNNSFKKLFKKLF